MPIAYKNIFNSVALRAGLITDGSPAAIETAYAAASLSAKIDSTEVPYSALKQDILKSEKEVAELIANSNHTIYKAKLASHSTIYNSGEPIPPVDVNNKEFIGSITGVFDGDTGRPLTEKKIQEIYRYTMTEAAASFFTVPVFFYAIDGNVIITTGTKFYTKGCIWDAAARETAFGDAGVSPLPSSLENLWICKVLGTMAQAGWFIQEASLYAQMAAQMERMFIEGRTQSLALPQIGIKQMSADNRD